MRRDSESTDRWCVLAEAYLVQGEFERARTVLRATMPLLPNHAPVLLRTANLLVRLNEVPEALRLFQRILSLTDAYDSVVFSYYSRLGLPDEDVLERGIGPVKRAGPAFLKFQIDSAAIAGAYRTLAWLEARNEAGIELADKFVRLLILAGRHREVPSLWAKHSASDPREFVYNGDFSLRPRGWARDWEIGSVAGAHTSWDEKGGESESGALRVDFDGTANVDFGHASQLLIAQHGRARLTAMIKTDRLTTDQGVSLVVFDAENITRLNTGTPAIKGNTGWSEARVDFVVPPASRVLRVQLTRWPSTKLNSRISGTAWLDSVSIRPI